MFSGCPQIFPEYCVPAGFFNFQVSQKDNYVRTNSYHTKTPFSRKKMTFLLCAFEEMSTEFNLHMETFSNFDELSIK